LYSGSKFALDGFGKALKGELSQTKISVLQCYPAFIKTNVSKNALVGDGVAFGKTDKNIENGILPEKAVNVLIKAMYLKRKWITLGSMYYILLPKLMFVSETINAIAVRMNMK
jgi:short-subunit dehydrogenase